MRRLALLLLLMVTLEGDVIADTPPHPRKAYNWETLPSGHVVLYFLEDGQKTRWVYKMIRPPEPATNCTHSYAPKHFKLITYDSTHPYFYWLAYEPTMKWSVKKQSYVKLKEEADDREHKKNQNFEGFSANKQRNRTE